MKKAPDAKFAHHFVENVLGREAELIEMTSFEDGRLKVRVGKQHIDLPTWLFVESINLHKTLEPVKKVFKNVSSRPVKYVKDVGFEFPCAFEEISIQDARQVAQWILKVTGK